MILLYVWDKQVRGGESDVDKDSDKRAVRASDSYYVVRMMYMGICVRALDSKPSSYPIER